jgi:membrane-associated protein
VTSVAILPSALPALMGGGSAATGLLPPWLDPQVILSNPALGPWVVLLAGAIIFAETGLLIGFFLPGDSLLFTAGLLVATGTIQFNFGLLVALLMVCAFVGNQVGYFIGRKAGPALFNRPDSRLFKRENVENAHRFFEKHGGMALVLARFVPIVRTFVPVIVGVAGMQRRKFVLFNAIGAVLWAGGVTTLGFILGDRVPWVQENLDVIFIVIVLISVVPLIIEFLKGYAAKRKGRNITDAL